MKKLVSLLFWSCLAIPFFSSCGGGNDNPVTDTKEYTVKYEATCANPDLYKLNIQYSIGFVSSSENDPNLVKKIIESPFSFEVKMKTGMPANIVVKPEYKLTDVPKTNTTVTARIYVNGKLAQEASGTYSAIITEVLK